MWEMCLVYSSTLSIDQNKSSQGFFVVNTIKKNHPTRRRMNNGKPTFIKHDWELPQIPSTERVFKIGKILP
jgi:hypothetical protein